uniref:Flavin-containing monooxygenase n=1 Tax=Zonotrichia albicollis TaxID=44394 RepID=A0A8D2MBX7_ZONAL
MLLAEHLLGPPAPHQGWRAQHWWWPCLWVPGENAWRAFSCGGPLWLGNRLEHTVTRVWQDGTDPGCSSTGNAWHQTGSAAEFWDGSMEFSTPSPVPSQARGSHPPAPHPSMASLSLPGLEKFEGCYLHSRDYKNPQPFFGKRVVVVGIGNSGIDIAVELSHTAKQVFLSTRRGSWVLHRVADNGYPFDYNYGTRFLHLVQNVVPKSILNFFVEWKLNARFDHTLYGLKVLDTHPTVNDDLPNRIISGRVRMKPNVQEFTETSAIFEDGTREDVDAVVFATGYSFSFPFLDGCVKVVENQIPLYKFVFPPDLEKPTLAFIGLIQPLGAIMPISELQSRWAIRVFKGLNELPLQHDMEADIDQRHTIQVDYIPYMDELACQLGVKPNLLSLFLTDPRLAMEVAFGPCTPYQYRLRGPGAWAGAREAILTQQQRILKPLQTRPVEESTSAPAIPLIFKLIGAVAILAAVFAYL